MCACVCVRARVCMYMNGSSVVPSTSIHPCPSPAPLPWFVSHRRVTSDAGLERSGRTPETRSSRLAGA